MTTNATSRTDEIWDTIIVGQGLAGTTLAWHLKEAGQRVLIFDAGEPVTASKIAAGLITPITGQRLVLTARCDEFLPAARAFYRRIERHTGQKIFHDWVAVRLFKTDAERQNWSERGRRPAYRSYLPDPQPEPLLDAELGDASGGGFAMNAAQLDTTAYLEASGAVLARQHGAVDWRRDVAIAGDTVTVRGHRAHQLISCEGFGAARNPYFSWLPFNPAKGDILTVRFHRPVPPRCLHRGIWVAPTREPDVFQVGSTYDWETLDQVPGAAARSEIEGKLKDFFHVPYTVLDHRAAVRPIINQSMAVAGLHPEHSRLGYFNGLGSKGALHAPWYAHRFADFLVHQTPLPEGLDLGRVC